MIAACILIQTDAGQAFIVAAALWNLPGVAETASLAGPCDVIAQAQAQDIDELAALVASRAQALDGVRRTMICPVVHLWGTGRRGSPHRNPRSGRGGVQAVCSCGWRSTVFGMDKTSGTVDPLQRAAEAADMHEWEMSVR